MARTSFFRVAFKPTATIARRQRTVTGSGEDTELAARGRHDPCVLPRARPDRRSDDPARAVRSRTAAKRSGQRGGLMMALAPGCAAAANLPLAWTGGGGFLAVCWLLVLWQAWLGWRSGLFRQMAAVAGLIAGWIIGLTQGPAFFAHFWSGSGLPPFILVPLASMFLGLLIYGLAVLAGRLLFKRACDHPIGPTRLFLGAGGAVVGTGLGLFGVWIVIAVARLAGAIAQIGVVSPDAAEARVIRPAAPGTILPARNWPWPPRPPSCASSTRWKPVWSVPSSNSLIHSRKGRMRTSAKRR